MKINRLLEITTTLLNKKTVTAKELSDRFGVSIRTIYRDIDVLSTAGVPVYTTKGSHGGISLMEDYTLNKALISNKEAESLLLALKTLRSTRYPRIEIVIDKLGSLFKTPQSIDWVDVDLSPWGSDPNSENKFDDIRKAILEGKVIAFDYINAEGNRSRRKIEPMQLSFKGQSWYLWGFCRLRREWRIFRISRIRNLFITPEVFERRNPEAGLQNVAQDRPKPVVTLKLKFQPEVLYRVYDDYDDKMIIKNDDGTCIITFTFPEDEWVYGYILSFGCFVEVLEPEHIRTMVIERMQKALVFYEK